ncbi:MAG: bis(5'-nucleosyl)-tetraphosphatase (symmetrical) YqeK [Dehalococcoidia bacterium]|nr:bis(5'-nucleosyl)-tetraphosphatase (symmetrical) YqeK [Dehalococcoidia bacterium]
MNAGNSRAPGVIDEQITRVEARVSELPDRLQAHIERARTIGRELSAIFGVDSLRVDLALAGHDLYRAASDEEMLETATRRGIVPGALDLEQPLMLHGPLAAIWMADEGGVADKEVLDAVQHHTTFAPGLGPLAATVFLADKIEPDKVERRPWLTAVADLAHGGDWKDAVRAYIERLDAELKRQGVTPHPLAMRAFDALGKPVVDA